MKAYASESYYIGVYLCGKEPDISAAFDFYAMQATSLMKQYTLDNVDENDIPEEVKMCCCELAEKGKLTLFLVSRDIIAIGIRCHKAGQYIIEKCQIRICALFDGFYGCLVNPCRAGHNPAPF